jgi:hypothetical protein
MYNESMDNVSQKSYKPMIAGILLILAGIIGLITWVSSLLIDVNTIDPSIIEQLQQSGMQITVEQIETFISICATIGIILSIFPLLGGILALKRKMWGIVLVMSIIGLFTVGPFFTSSILALAGLILIAISKNEFQHKSKNLPPIDEYS